MACQLVVGWGQLLPSGPVLLMADVPLPVLDAHPHGKIFPLHRHARLPEHGKGIPGRVPGGQNQGVGGQKILPLGGFHLHPGQSPPGDRQPGQLVAKTDVAAQGDQLLPDGSHHLSEHVGTDVGLVGILHVGGCSGLHQGVQHSRDTPVMGAGGQLAVGEGPCASLAELDVGALVQHTGGPEITYVQGAPVNVLSPLQNDTGQAVSGQEEGGKKSCRAHPHHHRGAG